MRDEQLICWNVNIDIAAMDKVMTWCVLRHEVDRMLFVLPPSPNRWRYQAQHREKVRLVYNRTTVLFGKYILDKIPVSAWPGTSLIGGIASAFVVEFNEAVKEVMLKTEPDLGRWLLNAESPLPEDMCLFKSADSHPIFVSHTVDGRGWLISHNIPQLQGVTRSTTQAKELFYKGDYFCLAYEKAHR
jgi:hypothetical protein